MTYDKNLQLPRTGEAMDAARISHWHVKPGDAFKKGDVLLEVETDKSLIEVPAAEDGELVSYLAKVDDVVDNDTPLARIQVAGEPPEEVSAPAQNDSDRPPLEDSAPQTTPIASSTPSPTPNNAQTRPDGRKFATPAARRLARENDLDIESLPGNGPGQRVTKEDVTAALASRGESPPSPEEDRDTVPAGIEDKNTITTRGELHMRVWTPQTIRGSVTLVLIHGLFGDVDTWTGTASAANRLGLRVVAMDLPCHGRSGSKITQLSDIIEAVAESIAQLCLGPVALVGHSYGAAVAAGVARKPDLNVTSLTLLSPVGLGTEIEQTFLDGMINAGSIAALEREMGKLTVGGITPSGEYLKALRNRLEAQASSLAALCRDVSWNGIQQLDIRGDLQALECPLAILCGKDDEIVPWQHALNAPPRTALHIAPGVGHMPQWETAALTGEIIAYAAAGH